MSLINFEGFEFHKIGAFEDDPVDGWTTRINRADYYNTAPYGSVCLQCDGYMYYAMPQALNHFIFGVRLKMSSNLNSLGISFSHGVEDPRPDDTSIIYFTFDNIGADSWKFAAGKGASDFVLGPSTSSDHEQLYPTGNGEPVASAHLSSNSWVYLELEVKLHATTGILRCKINNNYICNLENINTIWDSNKTTISNLGFFQESFSISSPYIDDIYLLSVDATLPNDFLGEVYVLPSSPDADGGTLEWSVQGSANHYANINATPASTTYPDATSYNQADFNGEVDLYGFENFSLIDVPATSAIWGLKFDVWCSKDGSGNGQGELVVSSNGTTVHQTGKIVTAPSSGTDHTVITIETNPSDSNNYFTRDTFNSAQFGFKAIQDDI